MTSIVSIKAREILDSRGNPTIEADVNLSDGSVGKASIPSGASTGAYEALELRDGDSHRFGGMGVLKAIGHIHQEIAPRLTGQSPYNQAHIDDLLIDLDDSPNKSRLGANAVLAVSIAVANASALSKGIPLYKYLELNDDPTLPVPMFNILNGGVHAHGSTDIQEIMVIPAGLPTFRAALRAGAEVYQTLRDILRSSNMSTNVGDEGGFAPNVLSNRAALDLVSTAIERAGYTLGGDCFIGLDMAASELYTQNKYNLSRDQIVLQSDLLIDFYKGWAREYHILSIEDGLGEDDWDGWCRLTQALGKQVQLVGDDLYATNKQRINKGIEIKSSNAVLIKLNQIGTLSEALQAFKLGRNAKWGTIISHRSGETEDTTIADLAVAINSGQIKAGAPCRSERLAKYNRLLRIEEELGRHARYAGMDAYRYLSQ